MAQTRTFRHVTGKVYLNTGMHNIWPAGQMWPAEAFNLARETPNFLHFASFFGKKHPLSVLKHINFGS